MPTLLGSTFSGFIRPSDPVNPIDLANQITAAIGKTVTVEITPTDILVTGGTLVSGDGTGIQTASTNYIYNFLQSGMPVSDNPDMSQNRRDYGITQHAAYMADSGVFGAIGKIQTSAGIEYGAWPYPFTATTNSSGVATIYLTSDGTSAGTVAFPTKVYNPSVSPLAVGTTSNYQIASVVVSGDRKTLTVTVNQLGSVVLGLVNVTTAASGVVVQGTVWGK
jgi:hypothetical protein